MTPAIARLPLPAESFAAPANRTLEQAVPRPAPDPEDLRLAVRVERALRGTGYGPLRQVRVAVLARVVTLAGRVTSYHLKQVAQTAVLVVPGVQRIQNDVAVV